MIVDKYEVRFFAAGKSNKGGDAIFVRLYDKQDNVVAILIDGGYQDTGNSVIRYMKTLGLDTIDLMINTHPDLDHISGLIQIMNTPEIKVKKLLYNRPWRDNNINIGLFKDQRITENSLNKRLIDSFKKAFELQQSAENKKNISGCACEIVHPIVGNSYFDCFHILGPTAEHYRKHLIASDKTPTTVDGQEASKYLPVKKIWRVFKGLFIPWIPNEHTSDINETSVVSFLQLPDKNFLFTGDTGKEGLQNAIQYLYEDSPIYDCGVTHLQLPHHGSRKNISPNLLRKINCGHYIISCPPEGENDGHPSARLVNKILEIFPKARIFKTAGSNFVYHSDNLPMKLKIVQPMEKYDQIED